MPKYSATGTSFRPAGFPTPASPSNLAGFDGSLLVIRMLSENDLGVRGANFTLTIFVWPGPNTNAPEPDSRLNGSPTPVVLTFPLSVPRPELVILNVPVAVV